MRINFICKIFVLEIFVYVTIFSFTSMHTISLLYIIAILVKKICEMNFFNNEIFMNYSTEFLYCKRGELVTCGNMGILKLSLEACSPRKFLKVITSESASDGF